MTRGIRRLQDGGSAFSRVLRTPGRPMLRGMGFTAVMRRPLPRAARKVLVPALAVVLAAGAVVWTTTLLHRAAGDRDRQVELVQTVDAFNQVEALPWAIETGGQAQALEEQLRGGEAGMMSTLVRLRLQSSRPALQQNFAAISAIVAFINSRRADAGAALQLAARQQQTLAPVISTLNDAAAASAQRAQAAELDALIGSSSVIAVLLAAFGFAYVRALRSADRHRQAREAAEASQQGLTVALAKLERAQDDRVLLLARTVASAENERRRIAADLHDGPIQRLTAAAFSLDLLVNRISRGERDVTGLAAQVRDHLANEMQALRRLMAELRPPVLDEGGVAAAIRDSAAEILGSSVAHAVHDRTSAARFTPDLETVIYRIAREVFVNVQKHARATQVTVRIERDGDRVRLLFVDDGVGFDEKLVAAAPPGTHFGLLTVRERAESAGGTVRIVSGPGLGSQIDVSLPWMSRHNDSEQEVQRAVA